MHFQSPSGNINCIGAPAVPGSARLRRVPRPQARRGRASAAASRRAATSTSIRRRSRLARPQGLGRLVPRRHRPALRLHIGQVLDARLRPLGDDRADPLHLGDDRRHLPLHARRRAPGFRIAREGYVLVPPMNLGIISTADINRLVIPRRARVAEGRPRRGRQPRPGARRGVRREVGDPARVRLVRGAARRPGDRGRLHLAAEHDARRVVDQVGRGRQARPLREAADAAPGRCRARLRRRRPGGADPDGGFMYRHNPQTKRCAR